MGKKVKDLSRGMKMKLMLAVAMSHDAKLLILDEPTSGLDPVARDELLDILSGYISEGNRSILFSTHIKSRYPLFILGYVLGICIVVINGIVATALAFIVSVLTKSGMNSIESLNFLSVAFLYLCLMIAVIFPLYFKFPFSKV